MDLDIRRQQLKLGVDQLEDRLQDVQVSYQFSIKTLLSYRWRGGGLGSRPKKMYGERLGDGVEYHLMKPTPRR